MTGEREIELLAEALRNAPRLDRPALSARIMASVASRATPVRATRRRFGIPLASAAAAAVLLFVAWKSFDGRGALRAAPGAETVVRFELVDPTAESVSLAGDFNGWSVSAAPLRRDNAAHAWTAELHLPPGRFSYSFVIDGHRWIADPAAARAARDDFGSPSSVLVVTTSKARL